MGGKDLQVLAAPCRHGGVFHPTARFVVVLLISVLTGVRAHTLLSHLTAFSAMRSISGYANDECVTIQTVTPIELR